MRVQMIDPHCRIGRVRFKGSRKITTRLPRKFLATTKALRAALTTDKQKGRA